MKERVRGVKVLILGAATYSVIINTALLFAMFAPMYVLSGPITGFISVITYNIDAFGRQYFSPALDMASFLSIIVITASTLNVATGLATAYAVLRKGYPSPLIAEALMASALVLLISLGTLSGIRRIIAFELSQLTRDYSYVGSAGRILIHGVHVRSLPSSLIFTGLTYVGLIIPCVTLSVIAYVIIMRGSSQGYS